MNNHSQQRCISWHQVATAAMVIISLAGLLLIPLSGEIRAGWIIGLTIVLWATGGLPEWLTAFLFFTLCIVTHLDTPDVIFAGLYSSAAWLVLSGIVLCAAINFTGLGAAIAFRIAPWFIGSFARALWGSILSGLLMTFIMPSAMSRVILLMPILVSLADKLGYGAGRNGRKAIILGGTLGTYLPATAILPANVPNNVLAGTAESLFGHAPDYGEYFLLHFPVMGALKTILLGSVLFVFCRDTAPELQGRVAVEKKTPAQVRLMALLTVTVFLWLTESWHGLATAWISMLAAIVCLFPNSGMMQPKPLANMNMAPFFYVAGIVSMGTVAYHSGLATDLAGQLLTLLPLQHDAPGQNFSLLSGLASGMGLLVTLPGVPAVLTPMTDTLSAATGWSREAVYMTQVVGFSTVLLPYQAPPLVIAIQTRHITAQEMIRVCLVIAILSILLLWPLDYIWWLTLGWI